MDKPERVAKGLILCGKIKSSGFYGVDVSAWGEDGFAASFYRAVKNKTRCELYLVKQKALAMGISAKFVEGWGRARFSNEPGDRTLVCPKCSRRYDELATLLDMNSLEEGALPDVECDCGSGLRAETVFVEAIMHFEVKGTDLSDQISRLSKLWE